MLKPTIILFSLGLSSYTFAEMNHQHVHVNHDAKMDHSKMDHFGMNMEGMSAVGMPAKGAKPDKVVHVLLTDDMKINFVTPVEIESNDIVQFMVMNQGRKYHEFAIGSEQEQLEHREMMKDMPEHHVHDSDNVVTIAPGKAKQLLWHFHGDKNVEFACNIEGHAERGMVKTVHLK